MPNRFPAALLGLALLGPLVLLAAQSSQQPDQQSPANPTPALTLHAESRIVLADITVTDRHGKPVHNLSASDFQVFDNGKPQRIASFEEHDATTAAAYHASSTPGVATNEIQHLPPVVNVLLIDTANLELPDQMYLRFQLLRFLKTLPPGQPLAVFERHGDYTVLLQPFTTDPTLVEAAVNRALPRFLLGGREYLTDTNTLRQVGAYLSQFPGRKNILWFSGGSTAYLLEGLSALTSPAPNGAPPSSPGAAPSTPSSPYIAPSMGEDMGQLREVYDELEAARIAVYPIDARALTTDGDIALGPQHAQMSETAEATGGEAYYNMNGLANIASHILATDSSSYTLTYSPQNFHYDGKWHNLRIICSNRDYHLDYRRGYFADKPHTEAPKPGKRKTFFAGDPMQVTPPDLHSAPLLFEATVHPAPQPTSAASDFIPLRAPQPPAKGTSAFHVDYSLSTTGLAPSIVNGASRATLVFAVIALDSNGERIGQALDRVRFPLAPDSPPHRLQVEQQIDLPKGGDFLAIAVWDPVSGRTGTASVPVTVGSPRK